MKKMYYLDVIDDYSRFTWVFFLATKNETSGILKSSITGIENLVDYKVNVIRCDNGTEFKKREMNQFYEMKGIYLLLLFLSTTVVETINGEAQIHARVDGKKAEAVNTACYGQRRVCPDTILNTKNHLEKFNGKADEGFFVGYSLNSKGLRVFNSRTRIVEEKLHIRFSENTPNVRSLMILKQDLKSSQDDGLKPSSDDGKKFLSTTVVETINGEAQIHARVDGKKIFDSMGRNLDNVSGKFLIYPRNPKRKDTQVPQISAPTESVADKAVYKELDDRLVRAATTASSIEAERVKKLKKKQRSRTHKLTRLYKVGLTARVESSDDEQSLGEDASKQGRISDIDADEGITLVGTQVDAKMFDADKDFGGEEVFVEQDVADKEEISEVTLAQALAELKNTKPKAKRPVIKEPSEYTITTTTITLKQKSQDKGKAIMVEEPVKLKKKDQIRLDEEAALRLKEFEFDKVQEMFNKAFKRVHTSEDFRIELVQVEGKEKRVGEELVKEVSKKQKADDDKETAKLKQLMEIILDEEEVAINAIPLAVKKPKRKDTQAPQLSVPTESVTDEAIYKELDDRLMWVATTVSSLEVEQDSGNIEKPNPRQHLIIQAPKGLIQVVVLESSNDEQRLGEDASKQGRISDIDADEGITLVNVADKEEISEVTLAQALVKLKNTKPKAKGLVFQEPSESTTTTTIFTLKQKSQDTGKFIMVEKPMKLKKKDQIRLDEVAVLRLQAKLQAKFDEEQRLESEKAQKELEANITLIKTWDDVQAKLMLIINWLKDCKQKSKMKKRNKPPTQAQKRKVMCTYLKNIEGYTLKQLKEIKFDKVQPFFEKAFKRVNTFKDFRTELVQGERKEKRAGEELIKEVSKKQKVDDNKETTELKQLLEILLDEEEVGINDISLAIKSLKIVDWMIHKEGNKSYYQIVRADKKSKMYKFFSKMLKSFNREKLEDLYKNAIWKKQQGYKVLEWKLYNSRKTHKPKKPKRKDTQVPQLSIPTKSVTYKAVYKELDDRLIRAAITASSLEAEQDSGETFMKRCSEECYDLIENMTAHHNDWDTSAQRIAPNCETCGGPHSFNVFPATIGNTQNVYAAGAYQEHETEATKDTMHPTNNGSTKDLQPPVVPTEFLFLNSEPDNSPIIEPVASLVSAPRPNQRPSIPFADALILIPKFGPSIKSLLTNKDKLCELARTPLNEHYSVVLLKKHQSNVVVVWNKLYLLDLSPMCMTLELADRSISCPVGVAKDVFVKVEAITFNLGHTSRYSANYNDMTTNRIDIIDMASEEYSQEFLGFSDVIASGNPTPYYDPIVSTTSLTLTLFENSDFLLEEVNAFLALEDDPTLPEVDQSYVNTEGDILLLEAFLNNDPSLPPPNQENYLPEVCKELKICEAKFDKSSIDEPHEVELKYLPPHLEYAFLKGDDKLPVINAKYLSVEEKTSLITVLKSHKRAIAWKLSDIKGVDPKFYTHKILMEKDFEPAVQHQRRVNPKIYDVIK
nr:hypothetical protein [Tanacetum cinerariifolium]